MDDSEDMIENVDRIRRKLPEYKNDAEKKVEFLKKGFLLIPRKDLLEDTVTTCENTLELLQGVNTELKAFYVKSFSGDFESDSIDEVEEQIKEYDDAILNVKILLNLLKTKGYELPAEEITRINVSHLENHVSLLNKLLCSVELNYLVDG